jgi:tryptophan 2,3-dioxygenase
MERSAPVSLALLKSLEYWQDGEGQPFPYGSVIACFRQYGKHFVPHPLLRSLAAVRTRLSADPEDARGREPLDAFLVTALDKWDDNHTYSTYLGLRLLGLTPDADAATGRLERARWMDLLLADLRAFESGERDWLPEMRPARVQLKKRLGLLDKALLSALPRDVAETVEEPGEVAERLCSSAPPEQARLLSLSMQPVYIVHDEYLFIRVLQAFEVTFAAMAAEMRSAVVAASQDDAGTVASHLTRCTQTLACSRILFSLLATMQPDAFKAFRVYTVGASAIQSESYKTFEVLCSQPARARLESPAFDAVPRVRDLISGERENLSSAVLDSVARNAIEFRDLELIRQAAHDLEKVHQLWKQTHWKMAVRMIGEERGTGYTVGVPYLQSVLSNRLLTALFESEAGELHA